MIEKAQKELDEIYYAIGDNKLACTDAVLAQIDKLEDIINPKLPDASITKAEELRAYCSDPHCNGMQCWECAAIRGGCPEDV